MKKFLITLTLITCSFLSFAQTTRYCATNFSFAERTQYGLKWGPWEQCTIPLSINWDDKIITIASSTPQFYSIEYVGEYKTDSKGNSSCTCRAKDLDNRYCEIAFRVQNDGTSQLYIYYNNCAWVYIVRSL